jgi:hypothetical protein
VFNMDRQTDIKKLTVTFCNFMNTPEHCLHLGLRQWTLIQGVLRLTHSLKITLRKCEEYQVQPCGSGPCYAVCPTWEYCANNNTKILTSVFPGINLFLTLHYHPWN